MKGPRGRDMFEKIIMENLPNLMREKSLSSQAQDAQMVLIKRNTKRPTTRHIIIKMAKL